MRLLHFFLLLISLSVAAQATPAPSPAAPEHVRLQLKWFNQFQFAGYYAAIEQGYFADEGLQVEIVERDLSRNFVKQVAQGESEYGVGDSGLVSQYAQGEPIAALAAIFQHNPLVFFSRQDSGIISPYEMAGKRVMSDIISTNEAPLRAMLAGTGITEKDYTLIAQRNDYDLLIKREIDVISGYLTDQPFYFRQKGLPINIINPQNYGIDFYGDILFTSQDELRRHPGRAERFRRAALKGWRYALDHPEQLIKIIHDKYHSKLSIEHLRFEAAETRKLILPDIIPIGQIDPRRLRMVADAYANSGFNRPLSENDLASFVYSDKTSGLMLTDDERAWIASHPVIRVGIDRDFAPYEWIDQNGQYTGLAADYMRLLEKKLGVRFDIVKDKSWAEVLELAKWGEIDMLSCVVRTPERERYLDFTEPYKATHAVIIDNGQGGFIGTLDNLAGKRVAVEKGYFMQEMLRKHHPQIQIVPAGNTREALLMVVDGKADAYVGDAGSANYAIKDAGLLTLRFSGQTEYQSRHSVAVIKSQPLLTSIVTKAMASISKPEADAIFNRWLGLRVEQGVKTETLVKYGASALLLLMLFGYWVFRLRREIAVRVKAEQQIKALLVEQKAMLENELVGIAKIHQRTIVWTNPAYERMLGYARGELAGRSTRINFLSDEAYQRLGAEAYPLLNKGGIYRTQIEHVRKDGRLIWVEMSGALLDPVSGDTLWAFVDITDRKNAEARQAASEARLRAIIASEPECIKVVDERGQLVEMNPAGLAMIEADSLEQVVNQPVQNLLAPEYRKAFVAMHKRVLAGEALQMEFEVIGLRGGRRWLETHAVPMQEASGHVVQLAVTRDITDRKRSEETLREAKEAAENLARSKSEFLANMSHEIRTPMNGIIGLTHLALNQPTNPTVQDYLQKIASSSQSLLGILNDILDFSKLEAGRLNIERTPFELAKVVDNLRNLFEENATAKYLELAIEVDENTPRHLIGDAMRIQQILANLLGNALKFTSQGHVALRVQAVQQSPTQATLRFTVEDSGIGIAPEDLDKLFKPFSQVDGSITRRFGGTGLGLAISHDLVELMGGHFEVSSQQGKGSSFGFELPLGIAATGAADTPEESHTPTDSSLQQKLREGATHLEGIRVLVVEDNAINQQVVQEFLALSGVRVSIAKHGQEALEQLDQLDFDAVLMDVHMPVMGGVEATQKIRAQARYADLPVIALTAGVTQEERENCLACGMNDFISKPVSPQELVATLSRWVRPKNSETGTDQSPSALPMGDTIDVPGFDLTNLMTMLGGQRSLAVKLLLDFRHDLEGVTENVRKLLAAGDLKSAHALVHATKGSAGNLGAAALHAAAGHLDVEIQQGVPSDESQAAFEQAVHDTLASLATLASMPTTNDAPPVRGNPS